MGCLSRIIPRSLLPCERALLWLFCEGQVMCCRIAGRCTMVCSSSGHIPLPDCRNRTMVASNQNTCFLNLLEHLLVNDQTTITPRNFASLFNSNLWISHHLECQFQGSNGTSKASLVAIDLGLEHYTNCTWDLLYLHH